MSSVGFTDRIPTRVYTAIKNNVKLNYNEYSIFKSGVDIVSEQDFENKKFLINLFCSILKIAKKRL